MVKGKKNSQTKQNRNRSGPRGSNMTRQDKIERVTFRRLVHYPINSSMSGGNTYGHDFIDDHLDRYSLTENYAKTFDQYRYGRIHVWAKISNQNIPAGDLTALIDSKSTTIYTAIDYDTHGSITQAEMLSHPEMKFHAVTGKWTKVACYTPRANLVQADPTYIFEPNMIWINTNRPSVRQLGLQMMFINSGGSVNHNITTSIQEVEIMVHAEVEYRGRRLKL